MEKINTIFDRSKPVEDLSEIHFQCLSWNDGDFEDSESTSEHLQYEIYISGVTKLGQSVVARVLGFTPYFYVCVPDTWTKLQAGLFFKHVKSKLWGDGYGLVGFDFVKKKKVYGYQADKLYKFVRLIFSTDKAFNKCKWSFSKKSQKEKPIKIAGIDNVSYYEAFETNIKHLNRFCHILDIETSGWIKITKFEEDLEYSSAQINITVNWKDIKNDSNTTLIAPLTLFGWDIECRPENTEEFPNPELSGDIIKQISTVLYKYGPNIKQSFIFTSSKCSPIKICRLCDHAAPIYNQISCENIIKRCDKTCKKKCSKKECMQPCGGLIWDDAVIVESDSEKKLLDKFCQFIGIIDPDFLIGFNTWGFDDNYLWKRLILHEIDISKLSRINQLRAKLIKKELSSSAYGNNEFNYLWCPARETFDIMVAIRREYKLDSYSLKFVSKFFLKEKKVDLPIRILFEKLDGGPDEIAECAAYCIQDSNLSIKLFIKLAMLPNYIGMAKTTFVPMEWLLFRGQQCKVFSLIAKYARLNNYVINVYEKIEGGKKFKGATVIPPMVGMYFEPIAGLDFASLYPSIMMAYNMCYTTFIATDEMMEYVIKNDIPYKTIEWTSCSIFECKNLDCLHEKEHYSYSFVQIEDDKGVEIPKGTRGLLGIILMKLMQGRKATKKLMKGEKDPFVYALLNGKQLAEKVTMNSVYGFTGAENGILPAKQIASSVTATGRKMIDKTSKMAGEKFGGITVYGDSLPGYELVTISKKNPQRSGLHLCLNSEDLSIKDFADRIELNWKEYRGFKVGDITVNNKECKDLEKDCKDEYYTYTHRGFQKVKKIIRHETTKKLYRIKARDSKGIIHQVVVTEGHSLILQNGKKTMAENLMLGTMLYKV